MIEYPKIETLYDRDEKTRKVNPAALRCPEFDAVKYWHVTEKIDGTNVRVGLEAGKRVIGGRTDNSQMPTTLVSVLESLVPEEKLREVFLNGDGYPDVVLFGEGYGPKIQKGGTYRDDISFILFDVWCAGWWLEHENVRDIGEKLCIETVPVLGAKLSLEDAIATLGMTARGSALSALHGKDGPCEGIIARAIPMMHRRRGERIMWKLKHRDF